MTAPPIVDSMQLTSRQVADAWVFASLHDVPFIEGLRQGTGWAGPQMSAAVARAFGYPLLDMHQLQSLRPDFDLISYSECLQRGALVARDMEERCLVVLGNPFDGVAEGWALARLGQVAEPPEIAIADPDDFEAYLAQQGQALNAMDGFTGGGSQRGDEEVAAVITLTTITGDTSPVVRLVNSTIYDALKMQASDIHLECDAQCLHVSYRVDGVLVHITRVQGQDLAEQVISRIKVMSELDIAERRTPQDGRFRVRVNEREVDFRVSIMPNIFGEDAVLRLLDRQSLTEDAKPLLLENLGLDAQSIASIRRLSQRPHGMLLVTGPTGSGKTTTLYAALTEIHTGRDKVVTIEDPVEYRLQRVLQIPVNEKKGLTFARGLRSILRHDPDKIMVGEIRDGETAQIAVQAALTGHGVFTTVHANTVFDVLGRFIHMGVDPYSFSAALNGIVAQRLLRLNCADCAAPILPKEEQLSDARLSRDSVSSWNFMAGTGCGSCRGAGYKGRRAIAEVLHVDDVLRELIAVKAPISALKEHAQRSGMTPLRDAALQCVARGETTLEEVGRVAG